MQHTSTKKLQTFVFIFQTEERILRVNKSKNTSENTFSVDDFDIDGNHASSKSEKSLFWVFLQIFDQWLNT